MKKRTLAMLLALVMLFSLLPASVLAEEEAAEPAELSAELPVESVGEPETISEPIDEPEDVPETIDKPEDNPEPDEGSTPIEEVSDAEPLSAEGSSSIVASGEHGPNLTWTLYESGTLVISGVGQMMNLSVNNPAWSDFSDSIREIVISEGVVSICEGAFKTRKLGASSPLRSYANVQSVSLPTTLETIGSGAFNGCVSLCDLVLPEGLKSIGSNAFQDCGSLKSLIIPAAVEEIGQAAFWGCGGLERLIIRTEDVVIGPGAFLDCNRLTTAGPVGSGCDYMFQTWDTKIPGNAFNGCQGLVRVKIPDTVTSIGEGAFANCSALEELTIPSVVTAIGREAFLGCSKLVSVTVPQGVHEIAYGLFSGCSSLTSVVMPEVVTSIGYEAFRDCCLLTSIALSDEITSIGSGAFYGCSRLQSVMLPEKLTSIEVLTFYNCSELQAILLPKSVSTVGKNAFRGCSGLSFIYYTGSEAEWESISIGNNNDPLFDPNVTIFYNSSKEDLNKVKSVSGILQEGEDWALRWQCTYREDMTGYCTNQELTIYMDGTEVDGGGKYIEAGSPPWLTETGFEKTAFKRLSIRGTPENPLLIQSNLFYGYSGVTEVFLSNIEAIYSGAFQNCTSLKYVSGLDDSLLTIGQAAFKNDTSLTTIDGTGDATRLFHIGDEAFLNTGLEEFVFCDGLETIGAGAFMNAGLTKAEFGLSLVSIGDDAFANTHLDTLELFEKIASVGARAFSNTGLNSATIGANVTSIGDDAFAGCPDLIIYCYADTAAYRYAVDRQIAYHVFNESFDMLLQYPSEAYNNDLAIIAADLCMATYTANVSSDEDVRKYLYELGFQDKNIYSNNYGGSLAFTIGAKPFLGEGADDQTDVLVIVAQGSTNPYELASDALSAVASGISGHPYLSFSIVKDFYHAIEQGIDHMKKHGILSPEKKYKILLTGHSLGGAAVDMMAASLSDRFGSSHVFCYTFGAINSIRSSAPVGYGNIHNIYNDLDTFSPCQYGHVLLDQAGTKVGKFGHLDSFEYEYREPETAAIHDPGFQVAVHINHDMGNYLEATHSGRVKNSRLRTCAYSIVACPVDVEVFCENSLVGRVTNNTIDEAVTTIDIIVDGDVKFILYPDGRQYSLRMTAFDEGTMSFYTQSPGGTDGIRLIQSVELTPGKAMSSTVGGDIPVDSVRLFVVNEDDLPVREVQDDGTEVTYIPDVADRPAVLTLDHDYLILKPSQEAPLAVTNLPAEWAPYLQWAGDDTETVTIDATGMVKAASEGTAWVTASVDTGNGVISGSCRIDVVAGEDGEEHPIAEDVAEEKNGVSGVRLVSPKVTTELFRTDYARIQVIPELTRNNVTAQAVVLPTPAPAEDAGAAVEGARFTVPAVADLFSLRVVDDRTLELIPTGAALENHKLLKTSYASPIAVTVDGTEFTTGVLTVTVKKTEPKITAKAVALNSYRTDMQRVVFSGGTVLSADPDPAKPLPDWLFWDGETQSLYYVGAQNAKKSAKVTLLVEPEGWAVQRPVTVSVSAKSTAPKLSFKPASLTLKPGTSDSASTVWTLSPALFAGEEVSFSRITDGKNNPVDGGALNVTLLDGAVTVSAPYVDGLAHTYKVWLSAAGKEFAFTVKTLADKQAPSLTLKAAGSIDLAAAESPVKITATTKNFHTEQAVFRLVSICKAKTDTDLSESFNPVWNGSVLTITAVGEPETGTYTATVEAELGGTRLEKSVNFTVKRSAKVPTASVTLKTSGSIDVLRPGTKVTLTPTVKNLYTYVLTPEDITVTRTYDGARKAKVSEDATELFSVAVENGKYVIQARPEAGVSHADKFSVQATVSGVSSKAAALNVKQGAAKLGISTKSVTLLKTDRYSRGELLLTVTDPALAGIARVELDGKGAALFDLKDLGNGRYAIAYAGDVITTTKAQTVKLKVYLKGNMTAAPNATLSVKVNFA